jgi:endonuclease YncB( thermonuclease family)
MIKARQKPVNRPLMVATALLGMIVLGLLVYRGLLGVMPWKARPSGLPHIVRGAGDTAISPTAITVIDGDTIKAHGRTVRLVGFDAPESGLLAQCERERELTPQACPKSRAAPLPSA